jgi:hypothetical protein
MKTTSLKKTAIVIIGMAFIALANMGHTQTVIYSDNFDIPDTTSLDGSDQTGRHTGLLATDVVGRSGGIQLTITGNQLNLLRVGAGNAGRMRFHNAANTALKWDFASGPAGAQMIADGGMKISFDWTAADNTSADWLSYSVGIDNSDQNLRVIHSATDSGILLRNTGESAVFKNGVQGVSGTLFDVTSLTRHVDLDYAFTSFADGSAVTLNAYVDGNLIVSQTFTWDGNSGVQNMEIAGYASGTIIDNFRITSFAPPPFISVSAVSDSPAVNNYAGRTVNLIGTVAGTQPITNQWKVDKGSGYVNVSASATNSTLTLANIQVTDSGTYVLFASNVAGSANSDPITLTVIPANTSDSINIQFTGSWLGSGDAPAQTGGAVIGNDGDVWNTISNPTGGTAPAGLAHAAGIALADASNVVTTVTLDYVGDYVFNGAAWGNSNPFIEAGSPVASLMTGYMGSVSTGGNADTNTVTLHHLKPGTYDLYLYSSGRNDGQSRLAVFTANGVTAVCGPNSGVNVLTAGTNYVHLTPSVGADGLLNISYYGTADAGQSQMNGLQLNGPVTLPTLFLSSDTTSDSPATNYVGRTVSLTASFGGNPPPAYQWKVDKGSGFVNASSSATNATLTLNNVQLSASGSYALFASNVVGGSNSTPLSLTVMGAPATNLAVNVQFVGTSLGSGFAATQTGPAVIGNFGDFWNPVSNPNPVAGDTNLISGSGQILADAAGIGTTITFDYVGNTILNSGFANPWYGSGSPAENLMQAALGVANTNTATVTLHNLLPGTYDVYLYSSGDNAGQTNVSQFTVNSTTASAGPNDSMNVLMEGTNYVHLMPTVTGNGLLSISFVGTTEGGQAQLNSLQILGPAAGTQMFTVNIERSGLELKLTWPLGTLLESANVLGPWTTNGATSPYLFTPSTSQKFYRVVR